jgi:ABC-type multidrug transport system ATPase subunit
MNHLQINNATKSFRSKKVLQDVSFNCKTGEILSIFGRNGCGKSTLLKMIFGTIKADFIEMTINGEKLPQKNVISSQKIGYLPQESFLPKGLKVREVIPIFFPNGDDQDKIFYAKNVSKFENNKIGNLSMGELRYLEILLTGNLNHDFLLLDEPFSMVEPLQIDFIKELLLDLKKFKGIILTDHYFEDVLEISDRNILLKESKILKIEDKSDLENYGYLSANSYS